MPVPWGSVGKAIGKTVGKDQALSIVDDNEGVSPSNFAATLGKIKGLGGGLGAMLYSGDAGDSKEDAKMAEMSRQYRSKMGKSQSKYAKGGSIMDSKAMVKKEINFFKKKGAPASMIKHEEKEAKGMGKPMKFVDGGDIETMFGDERGAMREKAIADQKKYGGLGKYSSSLSGQPVEALVLQRNLSGSSSASGMRGDGETMGGAKTGIANTKYKRPTEYKKSENAERMTPSASSVMGGGFGVGKRAVSKFLGLGNDDSLPSGHYRLKKGGGMAYAKGGGIESRGKTKGTIIRMAAGGSVSSRADGIARRGRTRI